MKKKLKLSSIPKDDRSLLKQARLILSGIVMWYDEGLPTNVRNQAVNWLNKFANKSNP